MRAAPISHPRSVSLRGALEGMGVASGLLTVMAPEVREGSLVPAVEIHSEGVQHGDQLTPPLLRPPSRASVAPRLWVLLFHTQRHPVPPLPWTPDGSC